MVALQQLFLCFLDRDQEEGPKTLFLCILSGLLLPCTSTTKEKGVIVRSVTSTTAEDDVCHSKIRHQNDNHVMYTKITYDLLNDEII